jgi:transcriptional regulator with XRE-family HTH domain
MAYDWNRVAAAVKDARTRRHWTQLDLAERAGVDLSTVKNLEGRHDFVRWPKTLGAVEAALGKPEGWARAIAEGRTPPAGSSSSPLTGAVDPGAPADDDDADDPFIQELNRMRSVTPEGREAVIRAYKAEKAREEEQRRRDDAEREERFRQIAEQLRIEQAS